jgi:hypothetical protein
MRRRASIEQKHLDQLEAEFSRLLITCLEACAGGRYGLFGQNDHLDPEGRYWAWEDAAHLKRIAQEIQTIRSKFGQPSPTCEEFLRLCSLRGSNVPGEPKLAREFLDQISRTDEPAK